MTHTIDQLFELACQLPVPDRALLVDRLVETIDPDEFGEPPGAVDEADPEWQRELARRIEEMESGKVEGIPWEQVQREMHERLKDAKTA